MRCVKPKVGLELDHLDVEPTLLTPVLQIELSPLLGSFLPQAHSLPFLFRGCPHGEAARRPSLLNFYSFTGGVLGQGRQLFIAHLLCTRHCVRIQQWIRQILPSWDIQADGEARRNQCLCRYVIMSGRARERSLGCKEQGGKPL